MALLSRTEILQVEDSETQDVEVPEWGGTVRVRSLTGSERDEWEASVVRFQPNGQREVRLENIRARLVALTVVDENGGRLFSVEDTKALGQKSAAALDRIFDVSRKLSRLTDEDVEELVEGFDSGPNGDSTSDLPSISG